MNLNNLKLGLRLSLGFGIVLALSLVIVAVSYVQLTGAGGNTQTTVDFERRARVAEQWFQMSQLNVNRVLAIAKAPGQPGVEEHFAPLIKATSAQISELQKSVDAAVTSDKGKELMADIAAKRKAYIDARTQLFEKMKVGDLPAAESLLKDRLLPASATYLAAMNQYKEHEEANAAESAAQGAAALQLAKSMQIALLIASLGVGVLLTYVITKSVTRPLGEAVIAAQVIARNDLTRNLASSRRDELGDLLRSLSGMQDALRRMVGQVRSSTQNISTASSEIATGSQDLSTRTEQTASNLQSAASSMEQLTSTVKQSADAARQANQLATSAAEVAARGGEVVSQVVTTMDDINESSKKIADIIGVIDGIAFQTNILALNAAVEAARAGEQGRGFAVVASEVRSLAQRSAQAAKEIKGLISASVDKVEGGSKLVADAGQTMQEIVGSVHRVSAIIGEITAASSEQSEGIGQINTSVNQLDQMTQQNAALVEQSAAAAESLKEQAQNLAQVVSTFKLEAAS